MSVALAILAAYRLAILISQERGPFDAATALRSAIGRMAGYDSQHWLFEGIRCPWCVSFWLALPCWLLATQAGWWGIALVGWWGVAGGVQALDRLLTAQEGKA